VNHFEGKLQVRMEDKYAIVVSKFNEFVTSKLLDGCIQTLIVNGVLEKNIDIVKVPGAFEIPVVARNLIDLNQYVTVICLGAVIRGETPHFDYICKSVSREIARLGGAFGVPVIFGVITTNNIDQALDRAGGKVGNKGSEAALSALEMVDVIRQLKPVHRDWVAPLLEY